MTISIVKNNNGNLSSVLPSSLLLGSVRFTRAPHDAIRSGALASTQAHTLAHFYLLLRYIRVGKLTKID